MRGIAFPVLVVIILLSGFQIPSSSEQADDSGSRKWKVTITFEHSGTENDPYFFQTITAMVESDSGIPGMFTGNGTGTWKWRDPPTEECPLYSGIGDFPANVTGLIGEVQTGASKQISVGLQAIPGRSFADFDDLKKEYTIDCVSSAGNYQLDKSSAPVPLLPQIILNANASNWYGEEIGVKDDCCVSKMTVTLAPPEVKYRIFGTIKDAYGHALSESKVVVGDYDTISGGVSPLKMLSTSEPDFEDETIAAESDGYYEFQLERPVSDPLRAVIVSLLWYEGKGQFAVTNGEQSGGRYVPVYQGACADHTDNDCTKWEKTAEGFEAQIDIAYGFGSAALHEKVMAVEQWNVGGRDMGSMIRAGSIIYSNSYKAMKYFESMQENLGNPLNPVRIDIYDSEVPYCKDPTTARLLEIGSFDYQATKPFGRLGTYLEAQDATGGTIRLCELRSSEEWTDIDAPINREYHELGHYLQRDTYYPTLNLVANRGTPHAGYANDGTNDSLAEGFAEFVAMLVAEHYNEIEGGVPEYPVRDARINLEEDYKVWGTNTRMFRLDDERLVSYFSPDRRNDEEWAVAGLLWDLHDRGREMYIGHIASDVNDPQSLLVPISEVYNMTSDNVALFDFHILDAIRSAKPMNLVDLYATFSGDVSRHDLDMIFINHGVFDDVLKRDLVHGVGESIGPTGSSEAPVRPVRSSPPPTLNGSYLSSDNDAIFKIEFTHIEPYSFYDYSYDLNMTKGELAYFEMPPSYYPSLAQFYELSSDGKPSNDSSLTINSTEYWTYIFTNPEADAVFKTINASQEPQPSIPVSKDDGSSPPKPSGCLIATAAFGSELAPQVQFLRDFRDQHIMATASGSSFMKVFNSWYYSFSHQVADYERQHTWLQQGVRIAIQPLLVILTITEKGYSLIPGELGATISGLTASSLIGGVYFWPLALILLPKSSFSSGKTFKVLTVIVTGTILAVFSAIVLGNTLGLMVTTSILVVSTIVASSVLVALSARLAWNRFINAKDA